MLYPLIPLAAVYQHANVTEVMYHIPRIAPVSPALQANSLLSEPPGKPHVNIYTVYIMTIEWFGLKLANN